MVGWIMNNDKMEYSLETDNLVTLYQVNNLSLNISKMMELIINQEPNSPKEQQWCQCGMGESFMFLAIYITNVLTWTNYTEMTAKKA